MDPNSPRTLEQFVHTFEQAAEVVRKENPDCIIAPMLGSIPFIDTLNIVDDQFPNDKVQYIPASSSIYRITDVLRGAFERLIAQYAPDGGSFLSLDEVVSGRSMSRVYKQFEAARNNYARKKTAELFGDKLDFREDRVKEYCKEVKKAISYKTIGVVQTGNGSVLRPDFQHFTDTGTVIPVQTPMIITMDRTKFMPARYKVELDAQNRQQYLPVVNDIQVKPEYIGFLQQVARVIGKNPEEITMHNIGKIMDSYQWVPEDLQTLSTARAA